MTKSPELKEEERDYDKFGILPEATLLKY